jgi:hypothetical protein
MVAEILPLVINQIFIGSWNIKMHTKFWPEHIKGKPE